MTTVAFLVTDAAKDTVQDDLANLYPDYTIGFSRKICAIDSGATPDTPPTHWYSNGDSVPEDAVPLWTEYATAHPELVLFTAINADNAFGWAVTNLASQGLQFVPDPEV